MNAALRRFSRRQMRTRPGRALLTLISIVLGVAAISAVGARLRTCRGRRRVVDGESASNARGRADDEESNEAKKAIHHGTPKASVSTMRCKRRLAE